MDGENNGKPYFCMDDLGGKPTIFGNTHLEDNGSLWGPRCFWTKNGDPGKKTRIEAWKALPEKLTSEDKDKDGPDGVQKGELGGMGVWR